MNSTVHLSLRGETHATASVAFPPSAERGRVPSGCRLAFLYPAFPVLHQTFVLWEMLALERLGLDLQLFSIKRPAQGEQQPEARNLIGRVRYLPSLRSPAVWQAQARQLRENRSRYRQAVQSLLREWYKDRRLPVLQERARKDDPPFPLTWQARVEAAMNTSASVYLLRSLAMLPLAAYLGEQLGRQGIRRVHAHWATFATTLALCLKWMYGTRFSFTAHAYDLYLMPMLLPVKLREADLVVTCARANEQFLRQLPGGGDARVVVNYHGVDLGRFRPRPKPHGLGDEPRLVSCGTLRIYKGHHVLLAAVAKMRHRARCIIVGEGPQRRVLERLANQLGIRDRVEFAGALPQEEAASRYAEADVFVLASTIVERAGRQDVIPNVLVEAMAMQLPVVSTTLPGIRELIEDGVHGRLVPPNDPDRLAAVLDELLDNPQERARLAAAGRDRVVERFDRERNVRELACLLATLPQSGEGVRGILPPNPGS